MTRNFKAFLLGLILIFGVATCANAGVLEKEPVGEFSVILGGWSKHHKDEDKDYNESHNMIGLEYKDVIIVKFDNSFDDNSVMLAYSPELGDLLPFDSKLNGLLTYGYTAGVVTGYHDGAHKPFILPKIAMDYGRVVLEIHILPTVVTEAHLRIKF